MTPAEHYAEAERLLVGHADMAQQLADGTLRLAETTAVASLSQTLQRAQVHATLATYVAPVRAEAARPWHERPGGGSPF